MSRVVGPAPSALRVVAVLVAAILAISFGSIFARLADAPGGVVAFWRMVFATALIAPAGLRGLRATPLTARNAWPAGLAGVLLAVHFATWLTSLEHTTVAASVALVSTMPIWVAALRLASGVPPTRGAAFGLVLAVGGGAAVGFGDLGAGRASLFGNALALVGAMAVAGYFLAGRRAQAAGLSTNAYALVAYGVASLVLLPLPALLGSSYLSWSASTWLWLVLIAVAPQLIGHGGLNWANRWVDPTLVATVALLEPLGAGLLAFALFAEQPGALVLAGAPVMLMGVALVIHHRRRDPPPVSSEPLEPSAGTPSGRGTRSDLLG
ncbi:MAG: DMT family transporter [Trueperaceae bacterium]